MVAVKPVRVLEFPKIKLPDVPEFVWEDAEEDDERIAKQFTVYPIKDREYIDKIREYLLYNQTNREHPKYANRRNCAAFCIGIHLSLRGSDLCKMRVSDFFDTKPDSTKSWASKKVLIEQKTGKKRTIYYNPTVINLVSEWIKQEGLGINDYMFRSQRPWTDKNGDTHEYMNRHSFCEVLRKAGRAVGYPLPIGTHSLRKTFCYQAYVEAAEPDKSKVLVTLQRLLNHTSPLITMRYLGFEDKEVQEMFNSVSLCSGIS